MFTRRTSRFIPKGTIEGGINDFFDTNLQEMNRYAQAQFTRLRNSRRNDPLHFILDENIVILAHKQEDDQGNPDRTCLDLMEQIIEICHPIVSDNYLWSRYQGQLSIRPSNNEAVLLPYCPPF